MPVGVAAGGLEALPGLLSRLPDVERGITRILHRTASPAEFVTTLRALAGVGAALRLARIDDDGRVVVDASVARSPLLRQLLEAAAAPEVRGRRGRRSKGRKPVREVLQAQHAAAPHA